MSPERKEKPERTEISRDEFFIRLNSVERLWKEKAEEANGVLRSVDLIREGIEKAEEDGLVIKFYEGNGHISFETMPRPSLGFKKEEGEVDPV